MMPGRKLTNEIATPRTPGHIPRGWARRCGARRVESRTVGGHTVWMAADALGIVALANSTEALHETLGGSLEERMAVGVGLSPARARCFGSYLSLGRDRRVQRRGAWRGSMGHRGLDAAEAKAP